MDTECCLEATRLWTSKEVKAMAFEVQHPICCKGKRVEVSAYGGTCSAYGTSTCDLGDSPIASWAKADELKMYAYEHGDGCCKAMEKTMDLNSVYPCKEIYCLS